MLGNKSHNNADRIKTGMVVSTNSIFNEMSCTALHPALFCVGEVGWCDGAG